MLKKLVSRRFSVALLGTLILTFALLLGAVLTARADPGIIFVRSDGDDALCNGEYDVAYSAQAAPNCAVKTIQQGITRVTVDGTVHVAAGTYNESVTVNKNGISLIGAGAGIDPLQHTIMKRTAGTAPGITIANNVTGVTIRDLRVEGYTNGGICAMLSNNNLTVTGVQVYSNTAGTCLGGIYMNGPVSHVLITDNDVRYNTTRGMVIWNGLKQYITITHNTVANNNFSGIELQDGTAAGVNITDNTIENQADSGMAVIGAQAGAGPNLIANNTLRNNGRFGIELKLANGTGLESGDGSIVVSGNLVERTTDPVNEQRDLAGIAVIRRGWLTGEADNPRGVVVKDNTVQGYSQPSDHEGFGIVIEGTLMHAYSNTLTNNEVGLQMQASNSGRGYPGDFNTGGATTPTANDEYFDRGNAPVTCASAGPNTFSGNTINSRTVGTAAAGTVTNVDTGGSFCTIQAAINDPTTLNGHTISVGAGTYTETLDITKTLTLSGTSNAVLYPPANINTFGSAHGGAVVWVDAPNVTLRGLTIDGDNPAISGGNSFNGVDSNAARGIYLRDAEGRQCRDHLTVEGVTLRNLGRGINPYCGQNHQVQDNTVYNMGGPDDGNFGYGILLMGNSSAQILDNHVMTTSLAGVFMQNNYSSGSSLISGNVVNNAGIGLGWNMLYGNGSGVVQNNSVYSASLGMQVTSIQIGSLKVQSNTFELTQPGDLGFSVWGIDPGTTQIVGNRVSGGDRGAFITDNDPDFGPGKVLGLTLNDNTFEGASVGVEVASEFTTQTVSLVASRNVISGNLQAGVLLTGTAPLTSTWGGSLANANTFRANGPSGTLNMRVTLPAAQTPVVATFNDWGVTDVAAIETRISHHADNPSVTEVLYYTVAASASPASVLADGSSFATVTGTLGGLYAPAGNPVAFTTSLGTATPLTSVTVGDSATTSARSISVGSAVITATAGYKVATTTVNFVASPVTHLAIGRIANQVAGVNFTLVITAENSSHAAVAGYNGSAVLSDKTGTVSPVLVGPFVNGVWSGTVSVGEKYTGDVLTATHPVNTAITGSSNTFNVAPNLRYLLYLPVVTR